MMKKGRTSRFAKLALTVMVVLVLSVALIACTNAEFVLTFEVDGEAYETVNMAGDGSVEMPVDPIKDGYTFDGWFLDKDVWEKPFKAESLLEMELTDNITIFAKWLPNEPAHTHVWLAAEPVAPTCTQEGYTLHACSCDETEKRDATKALGHDIENWEQNNGLCSRCEVKIASMGLAYEKVADAEAYSVSMGTCADTQIVIPAVYQTLPVTTVAEMGFAWQEGIVSISIPSSVIDIKTQAFDCCAGLESITVDADNPVYSSAGDCLIKTDTKTLILGCKNSIIPTDGSVTSIGDTAFYGCEGLTQIVIPNTVTSIGWGAFNTCVALERIEIPSSVVAIGANVFEMCEALVDIIYGGTTEQWAGIAKNPEWCEYDSGAFTVTCENGMLTKSEANQ